MMKQFRNPHFYENLSPLSTISEQFFHDPLFVQILKTRINQIGCGLEAKFGSNQAQCSEKGKETGIINSFFFVFYRESLSKQKLVVVQTSEWKFKANITGVCTSNSKHLVIPNTSNFLHLSLSYMPWVDYFGFLSKSKVLSFTGNNRLKQKWSLFSKLNETK